MAEPLAPVLDVRTDMKAVKRMLDGDQKAMARAVAMAMRDTVKTAAVAGRKRYSELVANAKPKVKKGDLKRLVRETKARGRGVNNLHAKVFVDDLRMPAARFPFSETGGGVIVKAPTGAVYFPGAWVDRRKGGRAKWRIMRRFGGHRAKAQRVRRGSNVGKRYRPEYPIGQVWVTVVDRRLAWVVVSEGVDERAREVWPDRVRRAVDVQLKRARRARRN